MADPVLAAAAPVPAPVFTAAHKVVIDCLTFAASKAIHDVRMDTMAALLAEALPDAHATGHPDLDRLLLAAVSLRVACDARAARSPDWSLTWADAMFRVSQAVARFAWWRLALSSAALHPELSSHVSPQSEPELAL